VLFAVAQALPQLDDVALVRAMAAGDSGQPLTAFYERFAGRTMALLQRMLGSRAEAEELLQDVFVELWRRAPQYDAARAKVSTWVVTIARSRALDAIRSRKRRGGEHKQVDEASMRAPESQRPDVAAAQSQRGARVREALAKLTDVQREALELSYFEGLSHREIAERIDAPVGTVKSRIIAAMKVLRDTVEGVES
jgi:RNA polymerase sigma-70 factor (ECF subfamily)